MARVGSIALLLFIFVSFLFIQQSSSNLWPFMNGEEEEEGSMPEEEEETEHEGSEHGQESSDGSGENPSESVEGITELTDNNFDSFVNNKNVLVEFYAPWCGACQQTFQFYKAFAEKLQKSNSKTDIFLAKIDVDKAPKNADKYKIEGIPTFFLFKKGIKNPIEYSDDPNPEGFTTFIKENTGIKI
eukprot:gene325-6739_t